LQSAAASSIAGRENRGSMQYQEQQRNERRKKRKSLSCNKFGANKRGRKTTPFPPLLALSAATPAEKRIQLSMGTKTKPSRTSGRCERASKIGSGRSAHHRGGNGTVARRPSRGGRRVDAATLRGGRRRRRTPRSEATAALRLLPLAARSVWRLPQQTALLGGDPQLGHECLLGLPANACWA